MTITERNQKLYDLRKKLDWAKLEVMAIESEIHRVVREYDEQNLDLFTEMFGEGSSPMDSAFMDANYGG